MQALTSATTGTSRQVQVIQIDAVIVMEKDKPSKGLCGEHGGDPSMISYFYEIGINYVSCSPLLIPFAILAAAQTIIRNGEKATK